MAMNCTEFDGWLEQTCVEFARTLPADAEAHLSDCASCHARWSAEQQLDTAICAWRATYWPQPFSKEPLIAALLGDRTSLPAVPRQTSVARRRAITPAAIWVVATCIVAVFFAANWIGAPLPNVSVASREPASNPSIHPAVPVSDSVAALWTDVQTSSQLMAQGTAESFDSLTTLPTPSVPQSPIVIERSEPTNGRWLPWGAPIGENFNSAFGFLGDVLPTATGTSG
jgi:hypothetical protein